MQVITLEQMDELIETKPLVFFYAHLNLAWCTPCIEMEKMLLQIVEAFPELPIYKIETAGMDFPSLIKYSLGTTPALIVFKKHKKVQHLLGLQTYRDIVALIQDSLPKEDFGVEALNKVLAAVEAMTPEEYLRWYNNHKFNSPQVW